MFDLIDLWDHKKEPDWRGLVCSLVSLKKVVLKWAEGEPQYLPLALKHIAPKYPLEMGDELCLLLAENKPDHAIELLEDRKLKLATVCKLAHIVCEEMPTYAWRTYQLISDRLDLMCGDHIALQLLAISAAERKKKRPAIISFLCNSIDSAELHEKFFAFWLKHKLEDKEFVEQTKQDLKEALKK